MTTNFGFDQAVGNKKSWSPNQHFTFIAEKNPNKQHISTIFLLKFFLKASYLNFLK